MRPAGLSALQSGRIPRRYHLLVWTCAVERLFLKLFVLQNRNCWESLHWSFASTLPTPL